MARCCGEVLWPYWVSDHILWVVTSPTASLGTATQHTTQYSGLETGEDLLIKNIVFSLLKPDLKIARFWSESTSIIFPLKYLKTKMFYTALGAGGQQSLFPGRNLSQKCVLS